MTKVNVKLLGGLLGLRITSVETLAKIIERYDVDPYLFGELLIDSEYYSELSGKNESEKMVYLTNIIMDSLLASFNGSEVAQRSLLDIETLIFHRYDFNNDVFEIYGNGDVVAVGDYEDLMDTLEGIVLGAEQEREREKKKEKERSSYDTLVKELYKLVKQKYDEQYGSDE